MKDGEVRVSISLFVSPETADTIDRLARERNTQRPGLILSALGVLHTMHDAAKDGYIAGLTKDREKLDQVLVAPL